MGKRRLMHRFLLLQWVGVTSLGSRLIYVATTTAAEESSSSSSSSPDDQKGYRDVQACYRKNHIQVTAVFILCDTPGAYYYGSNAYRNSVVCMSGDKANVKLKFTIPDSLDLEAQQPMLQIESGLYNSFDVVIESTSLCGLPVSSTYEPAYSECPATGNYILKISYTVPSLTDYDFHYTPDLRFTFTDAANDGVQLGCSTTGTVAIHKANESRATRGLVALTIAILGFVVVFTLLIYLSYRRKKRLERIAEKRAQGYQYFRTLPSGQVINISTNKPVIVPPSIGSDSNVLGISNPSYNEPRVPTRPII